LLRVQVLFFLMSVPFVTIASAIRLTSAFRTVRELIKRYGAHVVREVGELDSFLNSEPRDFVHADSSLSVQKATEISAFFHRGLFQRPDSQELAI
jgi:hypothetical protein